MQRSLHTTAPVRNQTDLRGQLMQELHGCLVDHFQRKRGLPEQEASELARGVTETITHYLGGQQLYVPKTDGRLLQQRNAAMFAAHQRGVPSSQLARQHKISVQMVNRILKRMRETETTTRVASATR